MLAFGATLHVKADAPNMDEPAIKARIIERLKSVDALKASGQIGEDNKGYLAARGSISKEAEALIKSENTDRTALYTIIGQRLGLTAQVVGESRAAELRKKSSAGVWLQSRDGKWYKR